MRFLKHAMLLLFVMFMSPVMAVDEGDYVSRDLFEGVLEEREEHIDWLETQLDMIEKTGIQNYLQSQM